ncbi:acyltransferase family protein [Engelhardtia mirabilis]|uniref:O-acetyltransferase OatA n=1 Tax=Engelhardtia mirabilis TaxID=2528011 RepID=A0A518BG62_9BACT|nr:O-acetyltransferase OatA [Planctomycetes bacterium Pla133]QDV00281.1 O-acetyltransferase OatA [Planctomycetes bacterium Pla86]
MPPDEPGRTAPRAGRGAIGALDGLRAIAVALVLLEHLPEHLLFAPLASFAKAVPCGYLGVDLFFVLSGFLITRILIVDRAEGVPVRWFLARRALRIFPAFYLLVAVTWLTWGGPQMPWVATYTVNYWIGTGHSAAFLQHTWSLAVEEHFYLLWPLAMAFGPRRLLLPIAAAGLIPLAIGLSLWLVLALEVPTGFNLVMYGTQSRMLSLLLGACLAFREQAWRGAGRGADLLAACAVGAGVLTISLTRGELGVALAIGRYLGSAIGCTGVIVLAVRSADRRGLSARALDWRPLAHLGRISYGIYLYHNPVIFLIGYQTVKRGGEINSWHAAGAVALTLIFAELSFWLWERPFLRLKRHFSANGR